ncbi:MAG: cytochrome P450 [Sphingomonadaceae bacterium]|jgi:cytochrome P450|nr:MAG: cytochrome P450 [Sphingomonadaceae bacterium]
MADQKATDIYAQHRALYASAPKPAHVPDELVVDYDYLHPAGIGNGDDVYTALSRLQSGPDIVWTPRNGGHWIVTRAEDIKFIQETYQVFSHETFTIPRGATPVIMPPLTVDPPNHARYRALINPSFTPSRVREMRDKAEVLTREIIETLKPRGACEFVNDFGRVMPVTMFLGIVDLPVAEREKFVEWGLTWMTSTDSEKKLTALANVKAYLTNVLDQRAVEPGNDLLSRIVGWRDNPRFRSEDETIGMALLIFFGGLDTVANMLAFIVRHLATNEAHRRRLIDEPEIIPQATEEFLRRFGLSSTGRLILSDLDYKDARFRKDDMVLVPIGLSGLDDRLYDRPFEIDFDRNPTHNTFGNGPHKCVGAPLARVEIYVFLQEWLKAIPHFRLDPDRPAVSHAGSVNGMNSLHLRWDV